jgi:putative transposase
MKKSRFSEEQILGALKEAEGGTPVAEVCRKVGVSLFTFYKWRRKYTGLNVSEAKKRWSQKNGKARGPQEGRCGDL